MPDDVLLEIAATLDSAEPVSAVRDLQRFRAGCKELRQRVAEPPPDLVQNLKYRRSAQQIRAVVTDTTLAAQQVETQVRALCDRYGDVRVVLCKLAGFIPKSPHTHYRNHSALAGIAASRGMRSLRLDLDGARDIRIKALCDALQHKAPTRIALTARKMEWGNVALAKLFGTVGQSESIISLAIACSGGVRSPSSRFMEQGGWAPKTAQALGSMLSTNRRLELLDLSGVYPGAAAMEAIAQAMRGNVGLGTLNLDGNALGFDAVQGLLAGLHKNRTLTALSLSRCVPGDAVAPELVSLFEHNDALRRLDLGHNAITGPVAACLARSLQDGRHLVALALPGNPIGSEGALAIGDLLASDTMLTSLDLSDCSIGDDGLLGLAQGLRRNTVLRHLNLALNPDLTAVGIGALASALKAHPGIASLSLCKLRLDLDSAQALAHGLLANHPALESLDMSGCEMELDGTRILVGAMEVNTRLKNLVMDKRAHGTLTTQF
jgi:Ran GTPase-activating protein (RanGAP) involved in mRNA processing and transport